MSSHPHISTQTLEYVRTHPHAFHTYTHTHRLTHLRDNDMRSAAGALLRGKMYTEMARTMVELARGKAPSPKPTTSPPTPTNNRSPITNPSPTRHQAVANSSPLPLPSPPTIGLSEDDYNHAMSFFASNWPDDFDPAMHQYQRCSRKAVELMHESGSHSGPKGSKANKEFGLDKHSETMANRRRENEALGKAGSSGGGSGRGGGGGGQTGGSSGGGGGGGGGRNGGAGADAGARGGSRLRQDRPRVPPPLV